MRRGATSPGVRPATGDAALAAFVRRQRRVEIITRVVCLVAGVLLGAGAAAFFFGVARAAGGRGWVGALIGAGFLGCGAWLLLRRALAGRDDLEALDGCNIPVRRFWHG